jgi:hypothetical protein
MMIRRPMLAISCALFALTFASSASSAQSPFEGAVTMTIAGTSGSATVKYSTKAGRVRLDIDGLPGFMQGENGTWRVFYSMMNSYVEKPVANFIEKDSPRDGAATVAATARTETIAGVECTHYSVKSASVDEDACIADKYGPFLPELVPLAGVGAPVLSPDLTKLFGAGFPLSIQRKGKDILRVTRLQRMPLSDTLFAIPTGFKRAER